MLRRRRQRLGPHLRVIGLPIIVFALGLTSCFGSASSPTVVVVGASDTLATLVAGFESQLAAALADDVEFLRIGAETDDLAAAIEAVIASEPDLVVTFTTDTSLTASDVLEGTDIPLLFGMVTDPVESGLVGSIETPGVNQTGVALLTVQLSVELIFKVTGASRIAVLYQPSDPGGVAGLNHARAVADLLGLEVVEMIVEADSDLPMVLEGGPGEDVDALYVVGSAFASRNARAISSGVATWDVPAAINLPPDPLLDGFLFGVATDRSDVARQMVDRAVAIIEGGSGGTIPVGVAESQAWIDLGRASRLGIQLSDQMLLEFDTVVGGV